MAKNQGERRRYPRVTVRSGTKGLVAALYEASLVNLSLGGGLIEHIDPLRLGSTISLNLDFQGQPLSLECRVIRSAIVGRMLQPDGERALVYHSGVEFLLLSTETQQCLNAYVEAISEDGHAQDQRAHLLKELENLCRIVQDAREALKEGRLANVDLQRRE